MKRVERGLIAGSWTRLPVEIVTLHMLHAADRATRIGYLDVKPWQSSASGQTLAELTFQRRDTPG